MYIYQSINLSIYSSIYLSICPSLLHLLFRANLEVVRVVDDYVLHRLERVDDEDTGGVTRRGGRLEGRSLPRMGLSLILPVPILDGMHCTFGGSGAILYCAFVWAMKKGGGGGGPIVCAENMKEGQTSKQCLSLMITFCTALSEWTMSQPIDSIIPSAASSPRKRRGLPERRVFLLLFQGLGLTRRVPILFAEDRRRNLS